MFSSVRSETWTHRSWSSVKSLTISSFTGWDLLTSIKGFASVISNEDKSDLRLWRRGVCVVKPSDPDSNRCLSVVVQQMRCWGESYIDVFLAFPESPRQCGSLLSDCLSSCFLRPSSSACWDACLSPVTRTCCWSPAPPPAAQLWIWKHRCPVCVTTESRASLGYKSNLLKIRYIHFGTF